MTAIARVITSDGSVKVRNAAAPGARAALCQIEGRFWLTLEGPVDISRDPNDVAARGRAVRRAISPAAGESDQGSADHDCRPGHGERLSLLGARAHPCDWVSGAGDLPAFRQVLERAGQLTGMSSSRPAPNRDRRRPTHRWAWVPPGPLSVSRGNPRRSKTPRTGAAQSRNSRSRPAGRTPGTSPASNTVPASTSSPIGSNRAALVPISVKSTDRASNPDAFSRRSGADG